MNLKEYLEEHRLTYREFAEKLGIRLQSLQGVVYGTRKPSLDLAVRIEELTDGKITPKALLEFFNNPTVSKRKYGGKNMN